MTIRKDVLRRRWAEKVSGYDDYEIIIRFFQYPDDEPGEEETRGEMFLLIEGECEYMIGEDLEIVASLPPEIEELPEKTKREMRKLAAYFEAEEFGAFKGRVKFDEKIVIV